MISSDSVYENAVSTSNQVPDTDRSSQYQEKSSSDCVISIDEHVLNEIAIHVTTHPKCEVYATLAADAEGVIRNHIPIDSERHVLRRETGILLKSSCGTHIRQLAEAYHSMGDRWLAGDVHSHLTGCPELSPIDERFCKRIWQSTQNTSFVVGLDSGTGPENWTVLNDGYEVQRKVNGHLLRVRAYAGTTEPKRIRILRDMA